MVDGGGRGPGEHHLVNPRRALTGPTPRPETFGTMAAEVSTIEHLITEALVAQERRLMLRLETASKAQESAELTMARRTARRRGALATTLGVAAGTMLTVFATAWSTYRDSRQVAEQAAVDTAAVVLEAKTVPIEAAAQTVADRVEALEERADAQGRELQHVRGTTDRILELLEPATEVRVPQQRKKLR